MGIDAFVEIPTWKEADKILSLTNIVVTTRPGFLEKKIEDVLQDPIFKGINFAETTEGRNFGCRSIKGDGPLNSIFIIKTARFPISSTEIRSKIFRGEKISAYLPGKLKRYIINNRIYKRRKRS